MLTLYFLIGVTLACAFVALASAGRKPKWNIEEITLVAGIVVFWPVPIIYGISCAVISFFQR